MAHLRLIMLSIVLACGVPGCSSSPPLRPDGIDEYVQSSGFDGLRTRRLARPDRILGMTPEKSELTEIDDRPFALHDGFLLAPVLSHEIPDSPEWEVGPRLTTDIRGATSELSGSVAAALLKAEFRFGESASQYLVIHEMSYLRLQPSWLSRSPSRQTPESEFDARPIVSEIMRANRFSLVQEYDSTALAAEVKSFLMDELVGEGISVSTDIGGKGLRMTVQDTPLFLGVKLLPMKTVVRAPHHPSRGNFHSFSASLPLDIIDPTDPNSYCRPVAETDAGVRFLRSINLYADDTADSLSAAPLGTPLRLDVIERGKSRLPDLVTNYLLRDIAPSEVAYCQITFPDPQLFSFAPHSRRADLGGIPDDTLLLSEMIGGTEYEVTAEFYDVDVAASYERRLKADGVESHRRHGRIDVMFRRNTPLTVGVRTDSWKNLRPQSGWGGSEPTGVDSLFPGTVQFWPGLESAQQLVLLRSREGAELSHETTPYLNAQAGSTRVLSDRLRGRTVDLEQPGRLIENEELVSRLLGNHDLRGVSSAEFKVVSSTDAVLNSSGFTRHYPRGVWVDTAAEKLVTHASSVDLIDLNIQATTRDAAQRLATRLQHRYSGSSIEQDGSFLSARGVELTGADALRMVSMTRLDYFKTPDPAPHFKPAGTCSLDNDTYCALGRSGYGVSLYVPRNWSYSVSVPLGNELSSFPVNAQLIVGGTRRGSPHYFQSQAGINRIVYFDVNDTEILEILIRPVRMTTQGLRSDIEWRLTGRPESLKN